jgi:hypothetical protein
MVEPKVLSGKTPFGSKQAVELSVVNFVFSHLATWRDDPTRLSETAEQRLSVQLSVYLDAAGRREGFPFFFQREQPQTGRRSVDIVANPDDILVAFGYFRSKYDEIIVFEAKRLPAPNAKRRREYVTGDDDKMTGGIQRFKACLHGNAHSVAAMLGYIQSGMPSFFYKEINSWISELCNTSNDCLCWTREERLNDFIECSNGTARAISMHQRIQNGPILLHHLWVVMK